MGLAILEAMAHSIKSEEDMRAFAQTVAHKLKGGEVVELIGDVGAGKTTFVKGLAKGLGINEVINSPTFTISQIYHNKKSPALYHYDFYRLKEPGLMKYELAGAMSDPSAVTVIEWAESVADILPATRVVVNIVATSEHERQVDLTGISL